MFHSKVSQHSGESNEHKPAQRDFSRKKSSSIVVNNPGLTLPAKKTNARVVRIRLVFIHIGEIDTLNEKYQADVYYEARWTEKRMNLNTLNLNPQDQQRLLVGDNPSVRINELNPAVHWSPQLFIENGIGQIGEQDKWFTIKKITPRSDQISTSVSMNVEVCEHRRLKGVFWEKLELNHFPADVQELTISITSHHHVEDCILVQDEHFRSIINREAFFDQQEWSLYEHVATEIRESNEEYSFDDENSSLGQKKHPVLAVACRAARRPGYYYWNGFCLIFLITVCAFCIFSISPDLPQSRLQITCTLLLTSVTFRWVVNRSLPQISYLTTLDIYAIISIMILVVLCVWHSIIASLNFLHPNPARLLQPKNYYVIMDRYVFYGLFGVYTIIHIVMIIWLFSVPYKRRREMNYLDREYADNKHIHLETRPSRYDSKYDLSFRRTSATFLNTLPPPTMKPTRQRQSSDGISVIPNATTVVPIREETNGVIIQGFRSYRDETVFEPFSQRYNIIVGRNGCGKSNFFFAIQFVLSDEFSNLSAEGRYNLMHEGINSRALNAYVEIIFDNSDSRIMIDKAEVAVRRQISGKKDNYFLDRKVVNKTDIINMLEGAGFSRSNPYYIVKQGKITQMATAPDANRLQLLREVAGTKVYDEKKQESEAILAETEERRKKIADLLKAIEERLLSLETEKEELKQYQKWDRSKRGLECAICTAECEDAKKRIDEIVARMNGATQKVEQLESDRLTVTELIQQTMDSITELKQRLQTQQIERETLIVDNKDNFQRKAQIELE
ncbi:unnamed protein product, partial [Adineta ricciae]